jgi:hypothetical protein
VPWPLFWRPPVSTRLTPGHRPPPYGDPSKMTRPGRCDRRRWRDARRRGDRRSESEVPAAGGRKDSRGGLDRGARAPGRRARRSAARAGYPRGAAEGAGEVGERGEHQPKAGGPETVDQEGANEPGYIVVRRSWQACDRAPPDACSSALRPSSATGDLQATALLLVVPVHGTRGRCER